MESSILVKEKDIVIPGEILAQGLDYVPGDHTYREENTIYSKALGLVAVSGRVIKVTALAGPYVPQVGDKIIARVKDITMMGWRVDTNTAYSALLNVKDATSRFIKKEEDLTSIFAIGDYLVVKIVQVTSQNLIDVTMREPGLHKIHGGRIIKINSQKVPRVIGKQGSMITLIKSKTGCEITIGQNGLVWVKGTPEGELLAEKTIRLVEGKSHLDGLTEKVQHFLEKSQVQHGI